MGLVLFAYLQEFECVNCILNRIVIVFLISVYVFCVLCVLKGFCVFLYALLHCNFPVYDAASWRNKLIINNSAVTASRSVYLQCCDFSQRSRSFRLHFGSLAAVGPRAS